MPDEIGMTAPTIHVMMPFENIHQCPQPKDIMSIAEKILEL
jgi:hypothetical protein